MTMLVTLVEMKDYLGVTNNDYDTFLTTQIETISEAIEIYCGRNFLQATYTETWYSDDIPMSALYNTVHATNYPVQSITSILADGEDISSDVRAYKTQGKFKNTKNSFHIYDELEIVYEGGFTATPSTVKDVVFSLVEERYSKKTSGVGLNFGNNVQRMSIPGAVSIDFDYTLETNDRSNPMGMITKDYGNVLDMYRTERRIVGRIKESIVE